MVPMALPVGKELLSEESCPEEVVLGSCQEVVRKLSKSCQKVVKKVVKSCQKVPGSCNR